MNFTQAIEKFSGNIRNTINQSGLPVAVSLLVLKEFIREMEAICAKEMTEGVEKNAESVQQNELAESTE